MADSSLSSHLLESTSEWNAYVELKEALRTGDNEKAKLLIHSGVKIDFDAEDFSCTPLHLAISLGCLDIVKLLVDKGASVNFLNRNKETPLVVAVKTGKFDIADYLLSVIDLEDSHNYLQKENLTLLHIACMRNKISIVKKFVESGESINIVVKSNSLYWPGYTPLHFAVQYQCHETVRFLLSCGADITIKDIRELTPLHLAYMLEDGKLVDLILAYHKYEIVNPTNSEGLSHFHIACSRNDPDVVHSFISYGVDANLEVPENSLSWSSFRPIDFAVYNECADVVKLLISCNVSLKNSYSESICIAYGTKNKKIIDLLLSRQQIEKLNLDAITNVIEQENDQLFVKWTKLNSFYWTGYTELHVAVKMKDPELVEILLKQSPSCIDAKDARGKTPLHLAFESKQIDIVDIILDGYESINENPVNDDGLSHFHISCTIYNIKVIQSFLKNGVDVNSPVPMSSKIYPGYTPLHFATEFEENKVYTFLLDNGADIAIKNKAELTAFDIAILKFGIEMDEDNLISIIESTLLKVLNDENHFFDDRGFSLLHFYCMKYKLDEINNYLNLHLETINKRINWSKSIYFEDSPLNFLMFSDIDEDDIKLFIEKGADIHFKNMKGEAILYKLLKYCPQLDNKKSLILSDDVNYVDTDGKSYFHLACTQGDLEIVQYFIDQSIDINKRRELVSPYYIFDTPFHLIVSSAYTWYTCNVNNKYTETLVKLFLEKGADVNGRDGRLNTPLHVASKAYEVEGIKILLNHGADVNAINLYYETPLHVACEDLMGNEKICLLLNFGADINIENEDGGTPFTFYISEFGNDANVHEVVVMMKHVKKLELINYVVNIKNKNVYKKMLHICEESGYYKEFDFVDECTTELRQLKNIQIDNYTSLYDLLFKSHNQLTFHSKNERLKDTVVLNEFYHTFPLYSHLIKCQFRQGVTRRPMLKECRDVFQTSSLYLLPESCVDHILQYLNNKDLQNIISIKKNVN